MLSSYQKQNILRISTTILLWVLLYIVYLLPNILRVNDTVGFWDLSVLGFTTILIVYFINPITFLFNLFPLVTFVNKKKVKVKRKPLVKELKKFLNRSMLSVRKVKIYESFDKELYIEITGKIIYSGNIEEIENDLVSFLKDYEDAALLNWNVSVQWFLTHNKRSKLHFK